jgi:hypothetical protein
MTFLELVAYFTQDSVDYLRSIDDIPQLATLPVPPGKYKSARSAKGRPRDHQATFERLSSPMGVYPTYGLKPQYSPYPHTGSMDPRSRHASPWHDHLTRQDDTLHVIRPKSRLMSRDNSEVLAPLAYLQNIPPLRRHPLDEKALMSLHAHY